MARMQRGWRWDGWSAAGGLVAVLLSCWLAGGCTDDKARTESPGTGAPASESPPATQPASPAQPAATPGTSARPAAPPASLANRLRATKAKMQLAALANACNAYFQIFNGYPGVVENPPITAHKPTRLSGCQNLRLALFGCARLNNTYEPRYRGPAEDIDHYDSRMVRKYEPFYNPNKDELVKHTDVAGRDAEQDADYGWVEVVVDAPMSPPRPVLYYRALPRTASTAPYQFNDNAVYCDAAKGETEERFEAVYAARARKARVGFLLISAGPDRVFFTADDITNLPAEPAPQPGG